MIVRPASEDDTIDLLEVERAAFGEDSEAELVTALLTDPTAAPIVNLVAERDGSVVGHVLLTRAVVRTPQGDVGASILAPLAVSPSAQGQGIGLALCREGLAAAQTLGVDLVFVLGHAGYYPRVGFAPALPLGLEPPYPVIAVPGAWMVYETRPGLLGRIRGTVRCADTLMHPELWQE